jgi:hypothetical protein
MTRLITQAAPVATPADWAYLDAYSDSIEDALVQVRVSASWLGGNASGDLQHQSSHHQNANVVSLTQSFYQMVWEYPGLTMFKPGTSAGALRSASAELAQSYPPVYIQSVT